MMTQTKAIAMATIRKDPLSLFDLGDNFLMPEVQCSGYMALQAPTGASLDLSKVFTLTVLHKLVCSYSYRECCGDPRSALDASYFLLMYWK